MKNTSISEVNSVVSLPLQTPLAFPWADDLLGKFLRGLRQERQMQPHPKQEAKQEIKQEQMPAVKQEPASCTGVHLQGASSGGGHSSSSSSYLKGEPDAKARVHGQGGSLQGNGTLGSCAGVGSWPHAQNG